MNTAVLLLLLPLACDTETIASAQANCDAYRSCLADVDPDASAEAETDYGEDSSCWNDAAYAQPCGETCATELSALHRSHPGSEACDDGTPVPSDQVLSKTSWIISVTATDGQYCDTFQPAVQDI